ncbi:hypothetical protein [Roseofilum casamattae]|uniref:Conjugal transfer protein TrbI n=1 Tax=Roseofilum casamattae BLCC-M143 TaxID=3022442 RepID=A0ABT7BU84_9CYAN|nr:hypothetical protein [Roseofilum casamattae]MDJ1182332.1 hypothetical protein [Roseofilum casamattae BLCC-M143]
MTSYRLGLTSTFATLLAISFTGGVLPAMANPRTHLSELFSDSRDVVIPEGVTLPVSYDRAETVVIAPNEIFEMVLTIPDNITSRAGEILIPRGSEVRGQFEPVAGYGVGTQFVAEELILRDGTRIPIDAVSQTFTETEEVNGRIRGRSVLQGAAIGAGAATILAGVTGDRAIATEEVLGGAGLGALAGVFASRAKNNEVFSIDPNRDLDLRLRSNLRIAARDFNDFY